MAVHTDNLTLGRGELHFATFKTGTETPDGFRFLGNCPSFSLTIESQKLDHFKSTRGIREKDRSIVIETTASASATCEDVNAENLALVFFGDSEVLSQTSTTGATETFTDIRADHSYQVGQTSLNPTGERAITVTSIVRGSDTLAGAGDDYTVDGDRGIITFHSGGGKDVVDGDDVTVTYDRAAKNRKQVLSGTEQVEGALRYIAYNPEGDNFDYYFPKVNFGPNGEYSLIGEEWQAIPWTIEILKRDGYERIYVDGQPYTAA